MKHGFTLMEVNLAVFIMAVGILTMVSLFPLGFRENQQSREDVAEAVLADAVLNPLIAALSSTNMTWSAWKDICTSGQKADPQPNGNGWQGYLKSNDSKIPVSKSQMRSTAAQVIQRICSKAGMSDASSDATSAANKLSNMGYALVVTPGRRQDEHGKGAWDFSRICLSLRATRIPGQLFAQPVFYTEVHFQGMR